MALAASGLPSVEQAEGVKPLVEQGQRVVRRARDKLFGQHHLVDGAALHDGLNKQVTGELHLAEHAHLWIGGLPMLGTGLGKRGGIVRGIRRAPHHAIDGEQLQPGPAGVIGLLAPTRGGLVKQAFDALVAKLLASLQEGAGGDKGSLTGQEDIELIDQLSHGDVAEDGHADDGSMGIRRRRRVATPSSPSRVVMSSLGMRSESDSN